MAEPGHYGWAPALLPEGKVSGVCVSEGSSVSWLCSEGARVTSHWLLAVFYHVFYYPVKKPPLSGIW